MSAMIVYTKYITVYRTVYRIVERINDTKKVDLFCFTFFRSKVDQIFLFRRKLTIFQYEASISCT